MGARSTPSNAAPLRWVGIAALVLAALWFWSSPILAPLRLLVVVFHESGHAAMAWATGGSVEEIALDLRGGGHTLSRGGIPLLILNAGYLGSLLAGLGLLAAARGPSRIVCAAIGLLLVAMLAWMPFSLGLVYVAATGAAFVAMARWLSPRACAWILRGIGIFSVCYALADAQEDAGRGDAAELAERTHVPAFVWTGAWLAGGVAAIWATRRWTVG